MSVAVAKLDTAANSQFESDGLIQRIRRGVFITGIDPNSDPATVLYQCVNATNMPVFTGVLPYIPTFPGNSDLWYSGLRITGSSGTTAQGYLTYETPSGFPPTAYLIQDSSQLMDYETNTYPGTRYPINIQKYIDPGPTSSSGGSSDSSGGTTVPGDNVTMKFRMRVRQKRVTKLVYGSLGQSTGTFGGLPTPILPPGLGTGGTSSSDPADSVGQVNDVSWQSKPIGHWLLDEFDTQLFKYQGYYIQTASAICRSSPSMPYFDWSEFGILRNTITQKYVNVNKYDIDTCVQLPYVFGQIGGNDKGFVRAGPYTTTSFSSVFGF